MASSCANPLVEESHIQPVATATSCVSPLFWDGMLQVSARELPTCEHTRFWPSSCCLARLREAQDHVWSQPFLDAVVPTSVLVCVVRVGRVARPAHTGLAPGRGVPDELPILPVVNCDQTTAQEDLAWLPNVLLLRLSAHIQRAHCYPFNYLEHPTDIVLIVVVYRLRYKLSLRDVAVMFLERGFEFAHEAVRDWEARFAPLITHQLRMKRRGHVGVSWHVDETYVKVQGKWCYRYRAIDRDGDLVDSVLSEKRNMDAARRVFQHVLQTVGHAPERVTTDGHISYPPAIREILGSDVLHRTNYSLNNRLEQDHRSIKQRYYPLRGFGNFTSASRFCGAFDEMRQFFRVRSIMKQKGSLVQQCEMFRQRLEALKALVLVA